MRGSVRIADRIDHDQAAVRRPRSAAPAPPSRRLASSLMVPEDLRGRILVVEVDGAYHAARRVADARRDRELGRRGWRVLRLSAELVRSDLAQAVARVRDALATG